MELTQYPKETLLHLQKAIEKARKETFVSDMVAYSHLLVVSMDIEQAIKDITFEETQTTLPKL